MKMFLPKLSLFLVCMIVLTNKPVVGKGLGNTYNEDEINKTKGFEILSELLEFMSKLLVKVDKESCVASDLVEGVSHDKITASTVSGSSYEPWRAKLSTVYNVPSGKQGSWAAKTKDSKQYIQVDLGKIRRIYSVTTKGRNASDQWVKQYNLYYSLDGKNWLGGESFTGNTDRETPVTNTLTAPIKARYVRLNPTSWHSHISMRFGVNGC